MLANSYSVPLKPGSIVEARAYSSVVEFRCDGERIAQHQRSYGRAQQVLDLEHYLEVLLQARRTARLQAFGAVASSGTMASQLRSAVGARCVLEAARAQRGPWLR